MTSFLKRRNAPKKSFKQAIVPNMNKFVEKMQLEVLDPRSQSSICIASVVSTQGPRIRLRLDMCHNFDFWKLIDDGDIHPIGFCGSHKMMIQPPVGFSGKLGKWDMYLAGALSCAIAAPHEFFRKEPLAPEANMFKVGHRLEAVDHMNPWLIAPATVAAVSEDNVFITFDGWGETYAYWCRFDSRDMFPVGWCERNGHPLEPVGIEKLSNPVLGDKISQKARKTSPRKPRRREVNDIDDKVKLHQELKKLSAEQAAFDILCSDSDEDSSMPEIDYFGNSGDSEIHFKVSTVHPEAYSKFLKKSCKSEIHKDFYENQTKRSAPSSQRMRACKKEIIDHLFVEDEENQPYFSEAASHQSPSSDALSLHGSYYSCHSDQEPLQQVFQNANDVSKMIHADGTLPPITNRVYWSPKVKANKMSVKAKKIKAKKSQKHLPYRSEWARKKFSEALLLTSVSNEVKSLDPENNSGETTETTSSEAGENNPIAMRVSFLAEEKSIEEKTTESEMSKAVCNDSAMGASDVSHDSRLLGTTHQEDNLILVSEFGEEFGVRMSQTKSRNVYYCNFCIFSHCLEADMKKHSNVHIISCDKCTNWKTFMRTKYLRHCSEVHKSRGGIVTKVTNIHEVKTESSESVESVPSKEVVIIQLASAIFQDLNKKCM